MRLLWATAAVLKINNSILSSHKNVQVYAIFTKSVLFHLFGPDLQLDSFFFLLISLLTDFIIVYYYSAFLAAKTISFLKFVHK